MTKAEARAWVGQLKATLGVNQRELAALLEVNPNTVSRWMSGVHPPDKRIVKLGNIMLKEAKCK